MAEQFKNDSTRFKELRNQILLRVVPLTIISCAIGITIAEDNERRSFGLSEYEIILPFFLIIVVIAFYISIKRQRKLYESYVLTIDDGGIRREQLNTPTIYFNRADITKIVTNVNGSITVKGKDRLSAIGIAAQIENRDALINKLNEFMPVRENLMPAFFQRYLSFIAIPILACVAAVFIATNKYIALVAAVISIGVLVWSFIEIQRSKNIEMRIKGRSYIVLMVIISMILIVIHKFNS